MGFLIHFSCLSLLFQEDRPTMAKASPNPKWADMAMSHIPPVSSAWPPGAGRGTLKPDCPAWSGSALTLTVTLGTPLTSLLPRPTSVKGSGHRSTGSGPGEGGPGELRTVPGRQQCSPSKAGFCAQRVRGRGDPPVLTYRVRTDCSEPTAWASQERRPTGQPGACASQPACPCVLPRFPLREASLLHTKQVNTAPTVHHPGRSCDSQSECS